MAGADKATTAATTGRLPGAADREAGLERQSYVRHELRGPLAVMYPLLSLLLSESAGPLTAEQRDYLAMLERNVKRLNALIGSTAESGWLECAGMAREPAAVRLADTVEEVAAGLRGADRDTVAVTVVCEGAPAVAHADPEHVRWLVRNLLDNALRYGGGEVEARVSRSGDRVVLRVQDHGRGMSAADAGLAFEFGVRGRTAEETGEPGMGIGLWVCRQLAAANGGTVDLASDEGQGTTVTVTLPAAPE